jgi:hypothetical protein
MIKEYNKKTDKKIGLPMKKDKLTTQERQRLWNALKEGLKNEMPCKEDYCILETNTVRGLNDKEIMKNTFVPEKPISWYEMPNEWLSNFDIMDVMRQYEEGTDFVFFGPTPIDFDTRLNYNTCVNESLCNINLSNVYKKGKRKIGVIFNLDPHTKSGSHWTALFADLNTGGIYYFDSYGIEPPKEVKRLMTKMREQGNEMIIMGGLRLSGNNVKRYKVNINGNIMKVGGKNDIIDSDIIQIGGKFKTRVKRVKEDGNIEVNDRVPKELENNDIIEVYGFREYYNPTRFQYKNSECGMFSMWFIIQFLENRDFENIIRSAIDDDYVFKKRDEYYRPNIDKIGKSEKIFGIFGGRRKSVKRRK